MKYFIVLVFIRFCCDIHALPSLSNTSSNSSDLRWYPDLRIDNLVRGYKASGRTSYAGCASGDFNNLLYGQCHTEWRGICLLTRIEAILKNDTHAIRAQEYWSSGTAYSQFEIIEIPPEGSGTFKVRRVGTNYKEKEIKVILVLNEDQ